MELLVGNMDESSTGITPEWIRNAWAGDPTQNPNLGPELNLAEELSRAKSEIDSLRVDLERMTHDRKNYTDTSVAFENESASLRAEVARLKITDAAWDRMKQENAHLQAKLLKSEGRVASAEAKLVELYQTLGCSDQTTIIAHIAAKAKVAAKRAALLADIPSAERLEEMAKWFDGNGFLGTDVFVAELRTLAKTVKENVCGK